MTRTPLACAAILSLVLLPACGGSSDTPSNPPAPTPVPPSEAVITVSGFSGWTLVTAPPNSIFALAMTVPFTMTESGGLGANWNYARLSLFVGGIEVERQEVSSTDIILQTGNNRLEANATRTGTLLFGINRGDATLVTIEFNFTDERGNNLTATGQVFP